MLESFAANQNSGGTSLQDFRNIIPVHSELDNENLLEPAGNEISSVASILRREALLLGQGIADGASEKTSEAQKHPFSTAAEFGGAAAVSAVITGATLLGGIWKQSALVASGAVAAYGLYDAFERGSATLGAMKDLSQSPENFAADKDVVARSLGAAVFDYALMGIGAGLGARAGAFGSTYAKDYFGMGTAVDGIKLDKSISRKEASSFELKEKADASLLAARHSLFEIAKSKPDTLDFSAGKISTNDLLGYVRSDGFKDWVKAEKNAGSEVFWPTDIDKTLASGDLFEHYFKWRAENNKFTPDQLKLVSDAVKQILPNATATTPMDVVRLAEPQANGKPAIGLGDYWSKIYWPSTKGMTAEARMSEINEFAPSYADKVYDQIAEVHQAVEAAGAHVVAVSTGDEELAKGIASLIAIKPENMIGSKPLYDSNGITKGAYSGYDITDPDWINRPQPDKPMLFHDWLSANKSRFGWDHLAESKIKVAAFSGDSAGMDGGMMIFATPKSLANFMVDTPGEGGRLQNFQALAKQFGYTPSSFITLTRTTH